MEEHNYSCTFANSNYTVLVCVCLPVFPSVFLHCNSNNNCCRKIKLEYIIVYEKYLGQVRYSTLSDQGQGHSKSTIFFSIYCNTNCQVL